MEYNSANKNGAILLRTLILASVLASVLAHPMAGGSGHPTNQSDQLPNSDIIKQRRPIILDLNAEYVPGSSDKRKGEHCGGEDDTEADMIVHLERHEEPSSENGENELENLIPLKWGPKGRRGGRRKKLFDSLGSMKESFV